MKIVLVLAVFAMLFVAAMFFPAGRIFWQFGHLERNARKVTTPGELQAWATNLLNRYPSNAWESVRLSELGTNFPRKLLSLYDAPPYVQICGQTSDDDVPHVALVWGGGFIGHTGLEVGPTNFPGWRATNVWAPGVYSFTLP